ncbi:MAG: glycoside hydrolase family 97 N-terminal domain-containing protein [Rikenellaceae bacterium]
MNLKKLVGFTFLALVVATAPLYADVVERVSSPDAKNTFELLSSKEGALSYQIKWNGESVILPSSLGLTFNSGDKLIESSSIIDVKSKRVNKKWKPVYGESAQYRDHYNESVITFSKDGSKEASWALRVRAYNEGVAFRYEIIGEDKVEISSEDTSFSIPFNSSLWSSLRAQGPIIKRSAEAQIGVSAVERPLLVEIPEVGFLALGEAQLVDFARMKFLAAGKDEEFEALTLQAELTENVDGLPTATLQGDNLATPWRYIMTGETAVELLQNNYMVLNLNEECAIEDTSWIKPGKVLREVTLTTQGARACVDFAKRNDVEYIMFDAGWYGNEYSDESDATTVTIDPARSDGPFDMPEILSYAKQNDVGIILYVNRRAMERQEEQVFELFKEWGIAGIKYGFVNVGSQRWTEWLHTSIAKASEYGFMVDVHDEYRPTGWSRTYPNFLTQEGVRGDEESANNSVVLSTLFTRMIAGAADQTNCYYADRVEAVMGSRVSQMAKMICIYSPFQSIFWYDRPEGSPANKGGAGGAESYIIENEETEFYSKVPTVWDETKVLEGYPGQYAAIARRSGNDWYYGALVGDQARVFDVKFDFLKGSKPCEATIYRDVVDANGAKSVTIERVRVDRNSELSFEVAAKSGLAIVVETK